MLVLGGIDRGADAVRSLRRELAERLQQLGERAALAE